MKKVTILGAGIGGISAGIFLLKKGIDVELIEGSRALSVKTCGEFLSYEAIELLRELDITPKKEIKETIFHYEERSFLRKMPLPCASMPRLELETALLQKFHALGGTIVFGHKVEKIVSNSYFQLYLDNGEKIEAKEVIFSTGRFQGMASLENLPYQGIKNHYMMENPPDALNMVFFPDGYLGFSPIDHNKSVLSCLVKQKEIKIEKLLKIYPLDKYLKNQEPLFQNWLTTPVGPFGCKKLPPWANSYFVGDAAATIPPISGQGMTISLISGQMVAEYVVNGRYEEYRKMWKKRFYKRIALSSMLHAAALSPKVAPKLFYFLMKNPRWIDTFFYLTRDTIYREQQA